MLTQFEKPADQGDAVKNKRAAYGEGYFRKYSGGAASSVPFQVRITAADLRIREGAGTDTKWNGKYTGKGVFTIVEVRQGKGSKKGWGLLKSYAAKKNGWVSLDFATTV